MSDPLVSVVTIFKDEERFIAEAVDSVLAQTWPNWELVLVDDGSADGSTATARGYASRHPDRIRYVDHAGHANLGMSRSRNRGVAEARGELIAFLDADDVYRPEKLERQVGQLAAHPSAGMVYGATEHWYSWTGRPEDRCRDRRRTLGVPPGTLVPPPRLVPLFLRGDAQTPGTCGLLVRREVVDEVGGFEDRFAGLYEDQVFVVKVCLTADVFVEDGSWDRYRQRPDSHVGLAMAEGRWAKARPNPATEAFLRWLSDYTERTGVTDPEVRSALAAALRPYDHPVRTKTVSLVRRLVRAGR